MTNMYLNEDLKDVMEKIRKAIHPSIKLSAFAQFNIIENLLNTQEVFRDKFPVTEFNKIINKLEELKDV